LSLFPLACQGDDDPYDREQDDTDVGQLGIDNHRIVIVEQRGYGKMDEIGSNAYEYRRYGI
jgi:hypothetical protein